VILLPEELIYIVSGADSLVDFVKLLKSKILGEDKSFGKYFYILSAVYCMNVES